MKRFLLLPLVVFFVSSFSYAKESATTHTSSVEQLQATTIFLEVRNLAEQNSLEKEQVRNALTKLRTKEVRRVSVTDGRTTVTYTINPETREVVVESSGDMYRTTSIGNDTKIAEFQFHIVDKAPVFPGCEELISEEERKKCMADKVQQFVRNNFDQEISKKVEPSGIYKSYVQFRINPDGSIQVLKINAPHPAIWEEMEGVLNKLPKMVPGEQSGEVVPVTYSFPIVLRIND